MNYFRPFERSASENDQIFNAIKHFDVVSCQFPENVLKELCVVAQLDAWKETELTGISEFIIVITGNLENTGYCHKKNFVHILH